MTYEEFYQILRKVDPNFKFYGLDRGASATSVKVLNEHDKEVCLVHKFLNSYELHPMAIEHFSSDRRRVLTDALYDLANTDYSNRYEKDKIKYYWRVNNSSKKAGSSQYLNIIEGGEALMIYDREDREGYRTLFTVEEFEEIQDHFRIDPSDFIGEPENSIRVEDINSCEECPLHRRRCGGWEIYTRSKGKDLPCFQWRPGDIVLKEEK